MIIKLSPYQNHLPSFFILAAFLAVGLRLDAQVAADAPPVPRLATAPATSAWTVRYTYTQADPFPKSPNPINEKINEEMRKANPRLESVEVTKAGDKRREISHYADGSDSTIWVVGDIFTLDHRLTHILSSGNSRQMDTKFKEDFSDLDWIDKADYQGRQNYQGAECYVYHLAETDQADEKTAYVNVATGLPQAVVTPAATASYSFRSSSDSVDVPPNVQKEIQDFIASLQPHHQA
jgi:hypothetical protein